MLGPANCHVPTDGRRMDMALTCLKLAIALSVAVIGISFAG